MRTLSFCLALALPFPALALSCMPYDAISSYRDAAKSKSDYVAVLGDLSFNPQKLPKVDWSRQQDLRPDNFLTGHLTGKSLSGKGFTNPFDRPININIQCAGPWCAKLSQGRHLAFLKRENGRYLLEVNPCGGFAHADPTPETLQKVKTCLQAKRCTPNVAR